MIKLLIKQGPFYITSFTALFLALANTGWLDRMFPSDMDQISLPQPMIGSAVSCNADGECTESFMLTDLDFTPAESMLPMGIALVSFIIGGIVLGYIFSRLWKRFV